MPYSTSQRMFLLSTPLGEDALLIQEFEGSEAMSQLFKFDMTLLSEMDNIGADRLVGKRVTLRIETADDERHWTGMVSAFERVGSFADPGAEGARLTSYRCTVVPWLWFMSLHEDTRAFQNLSIPEIVETILREFQVREYEMQLNGNYPQLPYCTQYNETSLAFISRLLERAGIYYYVKYEAQAEKLVFTDNKEGHPELDNNIIRFAQERMTEDEDTVSEFGHRQQMRSGKVALRDYNFETPANKLDVSVDSLVQIGDNSNFERYIYPGGYGVHGEGEQLARLMMEAEEAEHEIHDGLSNVRTLTPGYRFTLDENSQEALNGEYVITSVSHHGRNNLGDAPGNYRNSFSCIPVAVPYREPQRTHKPTVAGVQIAIVTGPSGEEIHTDEYGRVKVQFPWDRLGGHDDKSSFWVRVAQPHAGSHWGTQILPRVGEEVLVAFEFGDPDRPIIIGSLYNALNMPPYTLPAEATKSVLYKSNSSKGGGGFNELRFEDKAGSEEVFVHAQKDLQVRVGNDSTTSVGANQSLTVGGSRTEHIAKEQHLIVDERNVVEIAKETHLNIGQSATFAAGTALNASAGTLVRIEAGTAMHLKSGVTLVLEGGVKISLKAGPSSITLGPAGVTIDGPLVRINSGGSGDTAEKADKPDKPNRADQAITAQAGNVSDPAQQAQAQALRNAAAQAQPFCAICEAARAALAAMQGGSASQGGATTKAGSASQGGSTAKGGGSTGKGSMS